MEKPYPEDVKPGWLKVARHAQACASKYELAEMTIRVSIIKGDAFVWPQPKIVPVSPQSVAEAEMSPMAMAAILSICQHENDP